MPAPPHPPRRRRRAAALLALVAAAVACTVGARALAYVRIATGYAATITAAQHFAVGESLATIRAERIPDEIGFLRLEVDPRTRSATASVAGLLPVRARHRERLGATRDAGLTVELPDRAPDLVAAPDRAAPWPLGASAELAPLAAGVDAPGLQRALDGAFVDPTSGASRGTHAVVVAHRGELVAERYAPGYGRSTPLLGWSMTKSATGTLVGRLVHAGRLALGDPAPVREWSEEDDPRAAITVRDLLRMRSGLAFRQEHRTAASDSLNMLFRSGDCGRYAAEKPLAAPPGERWQYSDGTSNVLARLVCDLASTTLAERLVVPQRLLFAPLGMDTAFVCVDGSGTFVGSSLMYASARDWARLGQLYLDDGVWGGRRLLPAGWVDRVERATEGSERRSYGAHFWRFGDADERRRFGLPWPELLAGVFYAAGYDDQLAIVDRRRRVVAVRLGARFDPPGFDVDGFAAAVLRCFPPAAGADE